MQIFQYTNCDLERSLVLDSQQYNQTPAKQLKWMAYLSDGGELNYLSHVLCVGMYAVSAYNDIYMPFSELITWCER